MKAHAAVSVGHQAILVLREMQEWIPFYIDDAIYWIFSHGIFGIAISFSQDSYRSLGFRCYYVIGHAHTTFEAIAV